MGDHLLIDPSEAALRTAARAGHDLTRVSAVLLTRALPDRLAPTLLARRAAGRRAGLTVAGPGAALADVRDVVEPGDAVTLQPLPPDGRLVVGGLDVAVIDVEGVARPDRVGYAVTGRSAARLLVLPPTAGLAPTAVNGLDGGAFDVVLLPCGAVTADAGPGSGLALFAERLAELRGRGSVQRSTRVVAVHLDHTNPPPAELHRRLGLLGAEALADGELLQAEALAGEQARTGSSERSQQCRGRVLVLGGARSGKSEEAERRLASEPAVTYVATGPVPGPDDPDWAARVAGHRRRRPSSWRTLETTDLAGLLADLPDDAKLLVDDLGLWLTDAMDRAGAWAGTAAASARLADAVDTLVAAWRATSADVVAVSNEVGSGVHPETSAGRLFRDQMGRLNARLAAESDEVWYVVAGIPQRLR